MTLKRHGMGTMLGLSILAAGGHAEAAIGNYSHGTTYAVGDTSGNSNYRASYSLTGQQSSAQQRIVTEEIQLDELVRTSMAKELLRVDVTLFGKQRNLLYALADSSGQQRSTLSFLSPRYLKRGYVELRVAGNVVIQQDVTSSNCDVSPYTICNDHGWSQSFSLWKSTKNFTILGIPVTVTSKVEGTLSAAINARAGARRLNSTQDSPETFRGDAYARLVGSAAIKTKNTAGVGVEDFSAGVGGSFDLLKLTISPTAIGSQSADVSQTTLRYENTIPTTLTTMNGTLSAYLDVGPIEEDYPLVSWDGYTLVDHDPANFKGSVVVR